MQRNIRFWFTVVSLCVALIILGCRAAAPTATPVPPTPTKAPAPTVAPAPTIAPAPVATTAPLATAVPVGKREWTEGMSAFLAKYPQVKYYTDLPLPTTQPKYGGTFSRGGTGGVALWDVRTSQVASSGTGLCYGGLLRTNVDRFQGRTAPVPLPDAAESWKRLDETTYEFKLNPNVFWHDRPPVNGRRVTAEDLKWNIEQYREKSIYSGSFKIISEVTIKDPTTLIIKTTEPYAHLISLMAGAGLQFTAPEMEQEPGGIKAWCIGYGPFKLVDYVSRERSVLERHAKYHLKGHTGLQLPYFEKVSSVALADFATTFASFITGKTSFLEVNTGVGDAERAIQQCPTCQVMIHPGAGFDWQIAMRLDKPPFNDVRVRRALSMGFNRQALLDSTFKGAGYVSMQIPPDSLEWDIPPSLTQRGKYFQFNVPEAKKLLAEAGYPNGFATTMNMSSTLGGVQLSEVETIQFQLKQNLNVDIALKPLESVAYAAAYLGRSYEAMTWLVITIPPSSWDAYAYGAMYSKSPNNIYFINDPEVDKWAVAQRTTFDPIKQREAYKKLFDLDDENIFRLNLITGYTFAIVPAKTENVNPSLYAWIYSFAARSLESGWFRD
ncbi:MAG: ABC transporter substrate-binding protein [Chloroflexi bacterium]|nr:ABC transporter substrate-binding protein [Chloroflexota bacterium]